MDKLDIRNGIKKEVFLKALERSNSLKLLGNEVDIIIHEEKTEVYRKEIAQKKEQEIQERIQVNALENSEAADIKEESNTEHEMEVNQDASIDLHTTDKKSLIPEKIGDIELTSLEREFLAEGMELTIGKHKVKLEGDKISIKKADSAKFGMKKGI